jgi:hypothetical protein
MPLFSVPKAKYLGRITKESMSERYLIIAPIIESNYHVLLVGPVSLHFCSFEQTILWDNDVKSTKTTLREIITHYTNLEFAEGKGVIKCGSSADVA